jgi:hypothetical protein
VTVDGPYACVADDIEGVYIVDISNPFAPHYVQLLDMHDATAVSAANGVLYVTGPETGLSVFQR